MNPNDRALDQLVRDWWLGARDDAKLSSIVDRALAAAPASVVPAARALRILEDSSLASTLDRRLEELRTVVATLLHRIRQIDSLGDLDNEPESLFTILERDIAGIDAYDPARLRAARLMQQGSRSAAADALLGSIGWAAFDEHTTAQLKAAIADLRYRERFESWGLFVSLDHRQGVALGISFVAGDCGSGLIDTATGDVLQQVRIVARQLLGDSKWGMNVEWPATFTGESLGLPLSVAALTARGDIGRDALLASTGKLDVSGNVTGVAGIGEKIAAARELGMRRVLVPKENFHEASGVARDDLSIIPIEHIGELRQILLQSASAVELDRAGLTRLIRASVRDYGLLVSEEKDHPHGRCLSVGSPNGRAQIWIYKNGRVLAQGAAGKSLDAAQRLVTDRTPAEPQPREPRSFDTLTDQLRAELRRSLEQVGARHEAPHDNEEWRVRLKRGRSSATVVLYSTGKCVLQGTAPSWETAFAAMDATLSSLGGLRSPADKQTAPPASIVVDPGAPHIGTDEAGKGDYFGPLVSAAVYVDAQIAGQLKALGVRDSKALSDVRVKELAGEIRRVADGRCAITPIYPPKYNELYSQFTAEGKNLNSLLAWGHARSIDRLVNAPPGREIKPEYALVDQFANQRHIEERTRRVVIPIFQRPKAEDDIAVAAASILARDAFLQWIEKWSHRTSVRLPKGASPEVVTAAKQFLRRWGRIALADVAKLHFRTTVQVLEGEEDNAANAVPPWAADREVAHDS